jgi:hypothetical protein
MAMSSPDWIEESLERLEGLEQERDEHEKALESTADADVLRVHSEAIERLDAEIKQLYAALEAVAGDEEEEQEDVDEVVKTAPFERDLPEPPPEPEPELEDNPFAQPAPVAAAPVAAVPAAVEEELEDNPFGPPSAAPASAPATVMPAASFGGPNPMIADTGYDGDEKKGGALKWVVLLVLVGGGGFGGYTVFKGNEAPPPAPVAPTEAKVIDATDVPDDTQGPKGAKGVDGVTQTPDQQYSGTKKRRRGGGGKARSGGRSGGKDNSSGAIKLKGGGDPLG